MTIFAAFAFLQTITSVPPTQPPATIVAEPVAVMIAACDADGDARVTRAELTHCIDRAYGTAQGSASGSIGYLSYAEWALVWLGDRNALPSPFEIDTDNDNRITLAELQARFRQYFDRFDSDKDGQLSRAELLTIRASATGENERGRKRRR